MRHARSILRGRRVGGDIQSDWSAGFVSGGHRGKQLVVFALMVPLGVVVSAVFGQNSRERTFTEQNHHLWQAFQFACQNGPKRRPELRVAIVQLIATGMKICGAAIAQGASRNSEVDGVATGTKTE